MIKLLKSKEASNVVDIKSWPGCLDTDELGKRKLPGLYRAPTPELLAYLDFSVSTTGMLAGIKMSHARYMFSYENFLFGTPTNQPYQKNST